MSIFPIKKKINFRRLLPSATMLRLVVVASVLRVCEKLGKNTLPRLHPSHECWGVEAASSLMGEIAEIVENKSFLEEG